MSKPIRWLRTYYYYIYPYPPPSPPLSRLFLTPSITSYRSRIARGCNRNDSPFCLLWCIYYTCVYYTCVFVNICRHYKFTLLLDNIFVPGIKRRYIQFFCHFKLHCKMNIRSRLKKKKSISIFSHFFFLFFYEFQNQIDDKRLYRA